jgi:hypothetical protein
MSITKLFNLNSAKSPKRNWLYAVVTGTYCGELLLVVEEDIEEYKCISIPKLINRSIPKDKFTIGISNGIVEPVKSIPNKVVSVLKAQFMHNKTHK